MKKAMFVDVDGHILEPPDIWQKYAEPKYRERTLRLTKDKEGLECMSIDGQPSWFFQGGVLAAIAAIGKDVRPFLMPGKISYKKAMLPGGYDPHERIKVMDAEKIDMTMVYPSLGLGWESDCQDPQLAAATCRAYNNWVFDFCKPYPNRLVSVAHIPTKDLKESVKELKRTAKLGAKAGMISSNSVSGKPYGDHYFDPLWAQAQELEIPMTIHPTGGSNSVFTRLYPRREDNSTWWVFVTAGDDVKLQFTTMFNGGVFDRFPRLKVVVLESSIGWLVPWLDRMDDKFKVNGFTTPMKEKPSTYFQRQCFIAMDPDERLARFSIEVLGADKFVWAYDYPHSDSPVNPVSNLKKTLKGLPVKDQQKVMGGNAISLYKMR